MKFVKEFPWFDVSEKESESVKCLYKNTCDSVKSGYKNILEKSKRRYPGFKDKACGMASKGLSFSKMKGQAFYYKCQEKAPIYWNYSKNKCSYFLRKIKDKYSHRS
jgi:hypothetical protein